MRRVLAALLLAGSGLACSGPLPTAPDPGMGASGAPAGSVEMAPARSPASGATSVAASQFPSPARNLPIGKRIDLEASIGGVDTLPAAPAWYTVASKTIVPFLGGTVAGSRYRVTLLPLSLTSVTTISIREHSPDVLDFELLPHGTQFLLPVTVEVDYAGTSLDPAHPDYDGGLPLLLWLNPTTGRWELVIGVDNILTKKYTVVLTHFSRYAMGRRSGTAEW